MPIYSYKCTECGHQFEARQRFSDDPLTECPACGSQVRKVITPVGIVFKGSGFYVTDNKNGKGNSAITGNGSVSKSTEGEKLAKDEKPAKDEKKGPTASSKSSSEGANAASAA